MPYACKLMGNKWELQKDDGSKSFGTHNTKKECMKQMRALYANEISNEANIRIEGYVSLPWNIDDLITNSGDEIKMIISTEGGSYLDAIILHNKLRLSGKRVVCYVPDFALSAGGVLLLAADEAYIAENGVIMFHPPKLSSYELQGANELEIKVEMLRKMEDSLVTTLVSKTKLSEEECRSLMEKETYFTPEEAMELGIVNGIIPILRDVKVSNSFPERIVNFVKGKSQMSLEDICAKFGVEPDEDKLVAYIQKLQPKRETPVSDTIVNMLCKARETDLNMLVDSGKITSAVATSLKTEYITPERIRKDVVNDSASEFDKLVTALKLNEEVVNFKSKSQTQQLADPNKPGTSNPLVDDMKSRKV